ncbi:MAG: hypothetical protein GY874_06225 [Desulfobacteraceae bacterium]|nr:hypothetical protein [Desulfobacteraceae bacterium]
MSKTERINTKDLPDDIRKEIKDRFKDKLLCIAHLINQFNAAKEKLDTESIDFPSLQKNIAQVQYLRQKVLACIKSTPKKPKSFLSGNKFKKYA